MTPTTNASTSQIAAFVDQLAQALAADDPEQIAQAIAAVAWARKTNRHTITQAVGVASRPIDRELLAQTIQGAHHS